MIERVAEPRVRELADRFPVVAVIGPRQAGKTTICRSAFPHHPHISLDTLDVREFAERDPRGFFREYVGGAIIDGIHRAPALLDHLSEAIGDDPEPGRFIVTSSRHLTMRRESEQALSGRIGYQHVLPLSLDELRRFPAAPEDLWATIWTGGYPRVHDRRTDPNEWIGAYLAAWVQRDVRQALRVVDLESFTDFFRLVAGRTSREENLSGLAGDVGVTHPTIRSWISVLEDGLMVFRTPAGRPNPRRRAVKAARLHLMDSGVVCQLLGIREPGQLRTHPLRGAIFASWVASEVLKARLHRGEPAGLWHVREDRWLSAGLIVEGAKRRIAVETRSAGTLVPEFVRGSRKFLEAAMGWDPVLEPAARLVYAGDQARALGDVEVIPWFWIQDVDWV